MVFSCPADNTVVGREPDLVSGSFLTKCRVCDSTPVVFNDTDPRLRKVDGNFSFGPNSLNGTVNESGIANYQIWLADMCGRLIGLAPIAIVPRDRELEPYCCSYGAYEVRFRLEMPKNYSKMQILIVPFTELGDLLTVGSVAGTLKDYYNRREAAWYGMKRTAGAIRRSGAGVSTIVLVFIAVVNVACAGVAAFIWPT